MYIQIFIFLEVFFLLKGIQQPIIWITYKKTGKQNRVGKDIYFRQWRFFRKTNKKPGSYYKVLDFKKCLYKVNLHRGMIPLPLACIRSHIHEPHSSLSANLKCPHTWFVSFSKYFDIFNYHR